ncbi:MAG: hypothetical protein UU36_C0043G0001, partial [Candidatus Uhrbacteria bacterium GW2011_GWE2_41_1153]
MFLVSPDLLGIASLPIFIESMYVFGTVSTLLKLS